MASSADSASGAANTARLRSYGSPRSSGSKPEARKRASVSPSDLKGLTYTPMPSGPGANTSEVITPPSLKPVTSKIDVIARRPSGSFLMYTSRCSTSDISRSTESGVGASGERWA